MRRFFEQLRRFNLRNQIALFMIFGIVMTTALLTSVSYFLYKGHVNEIVETEATETLDVKAKAFQNLIKHKVKIAEMLIMSSNITQILEQRFNKSSGVGDLILKDDISKNLNVLLDESEDVLGIGLFGATGKLIVETGRNSDFNNTVNFLESGNQNFPIRFLPPVRVEGQLLTDLIVQVKGLSKNLIGHAVFRMNISELEAIISPPESKDSVTYGLLYSKDPITGNIKMLIPAVTDELDAIVGPDSAPSIFEEVKKEINYTTDGAGNEVLVAMKPMLTTDWNLILVTNQDHVFASFYNRIWALAVAVAFLVIMMIFLSYKFSYIIARPLLKMSRQAEEISKGNFDVSFVQEEDLGADDERGELANSLDHMTKDLKKYIAFRDGFLSLAAHELKTPLTVIQSCLDLVTMSAGEDPMNVKKFTNMAQRQCKLLNVMINDLLEVSRIQMGRFKIKKKKSSLGALIQDLVDDLNSLELKNPVVLINKVIKEVEYDEDRIKQVMMSLINNSIKYSKEETEIFINMEEVGGGLRVSIHDKGVGIPKEKQDQIFTQLYTDPATEPEKKTATLGVSLYVCKEIIEKHSGSIWFESKENVGTSFYFELPVHEQKVTYGESAHAA